MNPFELYQNPVHSLIELESICGQLSTRLLTTIPALDEKKFLLALSGVESSFGKNCGPRHEPAYAPGGKYFNNNELKAGFQLFGALASCSFGPFQILWVNCKELGFTGHPLELMHADISGPYVVEKLNKFSRNGANSIERILSCYNSGGFDPNEQELTAKYVAQFYHFFNQLSETKTD